MRKAFTGTPPNTAADDGEALPPSSPSVMLFTDEFAPVWTDPDTQIRKPMTAACWRAAGFEVHPVPGHADLYAVDLASRVKRLEPPPNVTGPHVPSTDQH